MQLVTQLCIYKLQYNWRRHCQASGGEVMFVSIEGAERNNTVVFETMMGDETISDGKKKIILGIR